MFCLFHSSFASMAGPFQFHTPCSILIVGPSGSGKTVFTTKLLTENLDLFEKRPRKIHYCYGAWQKSFDILKKKGVTFSEGVPEEKDLDKWFPKGEGGVLVMDDLMTEGGDDKTVLNIFTKYSHPLHPCLQEPTRSSWYSIFTSSSLSPKMENSSRNIRSYHDETLWIHGFRPTPSKPRRSPSRQ